MNPQHSTLILDTGTRLQLQNVIARSAFGEIWHATWLNNRLAVAVKRISPGTQGQTTPEAHARRHAALQREADVLMALRSPDLVRALDFGYHQSEPVLVLEALQGSLHQRILPSGLPPQPVSPSQALRWLGQIARGLQTLHRSGVRHLDIKPHNILLTADSKPGARARIADLGSCLPLDTPLHGLRGTLGWQAPEQVIPAHGHHRAEHAQYRSGPAADYYALGLLLFFMLTARLPTHCLRIAKQLRRFHHAGQWSLPEKREQAWVLSPEDRNALAHAPAPYDPAKQYARADSPRNCSGGQPDAAKTATALIDQLLSAQPSDRLTGARTALSL